MRLVIDTNVPIVANGTNEDVSAACMQACIDCLLAARDQLIFLDGGFEIFNEYSRHLSRSGKPGVGDAFFRWLWSNQANMERCRQVPITRNPERGYAEFPSDASLRNFDPSDRKFVAVAIASGESPEIVNAVDSDWAEHYDALVGVGVHIRFICPEECSAK